MWDASGPLYKLPRCYSMKPLAALTPRKSESGEVMLERIATSDPLAPPPEREPVPRSALDTARAIALRVSQHEGITRNARAGLDLAVFAIRTGATRAPTLVMSYMERGGGIQGHPRHLFIIADSTAGGYTPTFIHSADDSLPEFRRYIDHADSTRATSTARRFAACKSETISGSRPATVASDSTLCARAIARRAPNHERG